LVIPKPQCRLEKGDEKTTNLFDGSAHHCL
jgi:hypothetical protein